MLAVMRQVPFAVALFEACKGEDLGSYADGKLAECMGVIVIPIKMEIDQPVQFLDIGEGIVGRHPNDIAEPEGRGATIITIEDVEFAAAKNRHLMLAAPHFDRVVFRTRGRRHDDLCVMVERGQPADHMTEQGPAADILQYLTRQSGGSHPRLNDDPQCHARSLHCRTASALRSDTTLRPITSSKCFG